MRWCTVTAADRLVLARMRHKADVVPEREQKWRPREGGRLRCLVGAIGFEPTTR